jgi:hypothetical protein
MQAGEAIPVIGQTTKRTVAKWIRNADDTMLAFCIYLWKEHHSSRYCYKVTLDAVIQYVERTHDASEDAAWQARNLIERGLKTALLAPSTETIRGHFEKLDAEVNPSYDFGPILLAMEPVVVVYQALKSASRLTSSPVR